MIIGAGVMRVVGSSLLFQHEPNGQQIEALTKMVEEAIPVVEVFQIKMTIENHIDFSADEILRLIENVDSDYLGLNFDTWNLLRMLDAPIAGMEKLTPYTYATPC